MNDAVSTTCNAGGPIGEQQWFTLPTGDLGLVYAKAIAGHVLHGFEDQTMPGIAFANYSTDQVLECSGDPTPITSADHAAVVLYWSPDALLNCETDTLDNGCADVQLFVNVTAGLPSNDDPSTATAISALPYTDTAEDSFAPFFDTGGSAALQQCLADTDQYFLVPGAKALWWTYTATQSGDLPITTTPPRYRAPSNASMFAPLLLVTDITDAVSTDVGVDCGDNYRSTGKAAAAVA